MNVVVQDACILIDLLASGLIKYWDQLGYKTLIPDLVAHEITEPAQRALLGAAIAGGVVSIELLDASDLTAALALRKSSPPGLSVPDLAALFVACNREAFLLTGDALLRATAHAKGVTVKGLLWVLDEMVSRKILAFTAASEHLTRIRAAGSRLPSAECEKRFSLWSKGRAVHP